MHLIVDHIAGMTGEYALKICQLCKWIDDNLFKSALSVNKVLTQNLMKNIIVCRWTRLKTEHFLSLQKRSDGYYLGADPY